MCTLTIIPALAHHSPARLVMSRDEQRSRARALPPRIIEPGPHANVPHRIMPTDPQSGGTWIALNSAGLVFALLNVNPPADVAAPRTARPTFSRGVIIPHISTHTTLNRAASAALALDFDRFPPFRLIITDGTQLIELVSSINGPTLHHTPNLSAPFFATSSGLGDHHVDQPRRDLFNQLITSAKPVDRPEAQAAFHLSVFNQAPQISVLMSRPDASTVSITAVDLHPTRLVMRYHEVDDQFIRSASRGDQAEPTRTHTLTLDRQSDAPSLPPSPPAASHCEPPRSALRP
ncbi:MAG: NRDE family protein [Phycisphaerales bacterium]|nr:NRDE family protein [Phycisphaerales bacterium]